jgi:hypothetical protein
MINKKTKEAILESIEHWHQNLNMLLLNHLSGEVLIKDIKIYSQDCPLCQMFKGEDCYNKCPISLKFKDLKEFDYHTEGCYYSPWNDIVGFISMLGYKEINFEEGFKVISEELEFLYSLLPENN